MPKNMKMRILPALLGAAFSGTAGASGFQLLEQDASGIGNSYAGSAAVADSAGTIFYNAAGLTQLQGRQASAGLISVNPSFKFSNKDSNTAVYQPAGPTNILSGNGGEGGNSGLLPNVYVSAPVSNDLFVGLGIGAPFGLSTQYDKGWIGGAQSLEFNIETLNINPTIAWRANEKVSVGFGLDWQSLNAKYVRQIGTADYNPLSGLPPLASSTATLKLKDDAWGWNAGVLFNISPETKIGLSYRSSMAYQATGDLTVESTSAALTSKNGDAKADITLPDTYILSAAHQLNGDWQLLGDASLTGWSSIPEVNIKYRDGGALIQTLNTDFRDTWRVALGANYRLSDTTKLKMGVAYDQSPVKGAETRLVSMPDNDRTWVSLGAQWKLSPTSTVDLGGAYLFVKDASIHNDQIPSPLPPNKQPGNRGLVDGTYKDSAWILGAQYSAAF